VTAESELEIIPDTRTNWWQNT